jgi:hypothetical protein
MITNVGTGTTRENGLFLGIDLQSSFTIRDVLYLNRADSTSAYTRNNGVQIVLGSSTTDMTANTAIGTIAD